MFKINMQEHYGNMQTEEQYIDIIHEIYDDFTFFRSRSISTTSAVEQVYFYEKKEYKSLLEVSIPDKIMLLFALKKLAMEKEVTLIQLEDELATIVNNHLLEKHKKYFHPKDYESLRIDQVIFSKNLK